MTLLIKMAFLTFFLFTFSFFTSHMIFSSEIEYPHQEPAKTRGLKHYPEKQIYSVRKKIESRRLINPHSSLSPQHPHQFNSYDHFSTWMKENQDFFTNTECTPKSLCDFLKNISKHPRFFADYHAHHPLWIQGWLEKSRALFPIFNPVNFSISLHLLSKLNLEYSTENLEEWVNTWLIESRPYLKDFDKYGYVNTLLALSHLYLYPLSDVFYNWHHEWLKASMDILEYYYIPTCLHAMACLDVLPSHEWLTTAKTKPIGRSFVSTINYHQTLMYNLYARHIKNSKHLRFTWTFSQHTETYLKQEKTTVSALEKSVLRHIHTVTFKDPIQQQYWIPEMRTAVDFFQKKSNLIIRIDGPKHFSGHIFNNRTRLQNRLFQSFGYTVVSIPYFKWHPLSTSHAKKKFLKKALALK